MIKDLRTHDQILFFLGSIAMFSGIFLTNIFRENTIFIVVFIIILSIQILFFFRSFFLYVIVFLLLFCLGGYLSIEKLHTIDTVIRLLEKETVFFTQDTIIKGTLLEGIWENNKSARYILRNITLGAQVFPPKFGILVSFPDSRGENIDDIIAFTGKLALPLNNGNFDYKTYLLLDDVFATTSISLAEKIGTDHSSWLDWYIRQIRARFLSIIEDIYPGESAKLLEGMLIWERANLSTETKISFNNSGLTHIIAVSGFNITIILIFLSFLLRSFPVVFRLILASACILFFTLLVGPQISVLRASVFGLISYAILLSWRKIYAFSLLLGVALGFVILNPLILNYDISFHLSFLAVLGLLFFGDFFVRLFSFVPKWFGIRESLAMCLAAMTFTLPILVINFWQISLVSPIANIAIVPLIPLTMLIGFASILTALFSAHLAIIVGFPAWLGLTYMLVTISWFGNLSHGVMSIDFAQYSSIFEITYFLILIFIIIYFREKKETT